MATEWLRNPDILVLTPLAAGFLCALLLAATRRLLSPQRPAWRLARALVVVGLVSATSAASCRLFVGLHGVAVPTGEAIDRAVIAWGAGAAAYAVVFGGLVLTLVEGRSLRDMGWHVRGAVKYAAAGLIVGAALGVFLPTHGDYRWVARFVPRAGTIRVIAVVPATALVAMLIRAFAQAAWTEENLFRGHLLPSLQEVGVSPRWANVMQAAIFGAYHLPAWIAARPANLPGDPGDPAMWVGMGMGFGLWGLVCGLLRLRTGSIVPGFVLHGTYDFFRLVLTLGPTAAIASHVIRR